MKIEWNTVTWYSKLLSVLLFIVIVPMLTFYIGAQYQKTVDGFVNQNSIYFQPITSKNSSKESTLPVTFQGHISKGQSFQKDVGNGLIFKLTPDNNGWNVGVVPQGGLSESDYDLAGIATPPFHGINDLQIEGWHFRNADNTADGSVNAPQEERNFQFVLNEEDAQKMDAYIRNFDGGNFSPPVPIGEGKLVIKNLKLGNLLPGSQAWIESMDFTVNISF